jgi:RimJ/RimL family protein N-acetyltransferase
MAETVTGCARRSQAVGSRRFAFDTRAPHGLASLPISMRVAPMNTSVSLRPFDPALLPVLARWFEQPHVTPWFPERGANLGWAAEPPRGGAQAAICEHERAVGWLRWQRVSREVLDSLGFDDIPANSVDADILLGEEASVGRGVGPTALRLLIERLHREGDVPMVGLTTNVANTHAHRAFEKAGFRIDRQYDPNGHGLCHLMLLDLR